MESTRVLTLHLLETAATQRSETPRAQLHSLSVKPPGSVLQLKDPTEWDC